MSKHHFLFEKILLGEIFLGRNKLFLEAAIIFPLLPILDHATSDKKPIFAPISTKVSLALRFASMLNESNSENIGFNHNDIDNDVGKNLSFIFL